MEFIKKILTSFITIWIVIIVMASYLYYISGTLFSLDKRYNNRNVPVLSINPYKTTNESDFGYADVDVNWLYAIETLNKVENNNIQARIILLNTSIFTRQIQTIRVYPMDKDKAETIVIEVNKVVRSGDKVYIDFKAPHVRSSTSYHGYMDWSFRVFDTFSEKLMN